MTPSTTDITLAESDDGLAPIVADLSVDYGGVSYAVWTKSTRSTHGVYWRHQVTRWCLGEDDADMQRPLDELPDEVASEVDDALGRYVR